jgi:2-polyprenyl-3-methyl-5-hydroxy-6-metoxy-1,4-benzoquinol methylase
MIRIISEESAYHWAEVQENSIYIQTKKDNSFDESLDRNKGYRWFFEVFLENTGHLEEKIKMLDAGCNDGRIAYELQKLGHKVLGIDILENSIQYYKILVPDAEFKVADLVNFDNDEALFEKFDYVNCVDVIEHLHLDYQLAVIKNLNTVLKHNGKIIISFPTVRIPMSKLHYKHFTLEELKKLLENGGFEVEQVIGNYKLNFLSRILLNDKLCLLIWNGYWRFGCVARLINNTYMKFINYADEENAGGYIIVGVKKERCLE